MLHGLENIKSENEISDSSDVSEETPSWSDVSGIDTEEQEEEVVEEFQAIKDVSSKEEIIKLNNLEEQLVSIGMQKSENLKEEKIKLQNIGKILNEQMTILKYAVKKYNKKVAKVKINYKKYVIYNENEDEDDGDENISSQISEDENFLIPTKKEDSSVPKLDDGSVPKLDDGSMPKPDDGSVHKPDDGGVHKPDGNNKKFPLKTDILSNVEPNTIIVDPAGSAFMPKQTTYTGGGLSGIIYKHYGLIGVSHKLSPINEGDAKLNDELNLPNNVKLIHAVGPNYSDKNTDNNFWNILDKTIKAIGDEIVKLRALGDNTKYIIRIPFISSGIFAPKDLNFEEYFGNYYSYVKTNIIDPNLTIELAAREQKIIDSYNKLP